MSAGNVFELPNSMYRQWRVVESDLRAQLQVGLDLSPAEVDRVVQAVQPLYLKWATPKAVSLNGTGQEDPVKLINDYVRQLLQGLLFEIVRREIELIRAGVRG